MADPTRRQIIALLAQHPRRPKAVAGELGLSFPAVSRQLDLLLEAGLVRRLPTIADGRGALYFLEERARGRIIAWLAGTEVGIEYQAFRSADAQDVADLATSEVLGSATEAE